MTDVYSWPTELPQYPLVGTWSSQLQTNDVEAPADVGQGDIRTRSTAVSEVVTFSMIMSSYQLKVLRKFYKNTTRGRVYPFTFFHPEEEETKEFRFFEPYKPQHTGDQWYQVSITLISKAE